ncbi:hypothetical protein ACRAWD_10785 [Caulobacter segnis]
MRAAVDKDTNTLLVSAPAWRWGADPEDPGRTRQASEPGPDRGLGARGHLGRQFPSSASTGRSSATTTTSRPPAPAATAGAISPTYPGFSLTFLDVSTHRRYDQRPRGANEVSEVVPAPKIITLDNKTAHLQVGDQVPIVTQTSQSTQGANAPVVNNVDYRNSGVILSVTPRISGENRIILQVSQEVSLGHPDPQFRRSTLPPSSSASSKANAHLEGWRGARAPWRPDQPHPPTRAHAADAPGSKTDGIPGNGRLFRDPQHCEHRAHRADRTPKLRARVMTVWRTNPAAPCSNLTSDVRELRTAPPWVAWPMGGSGAETVRHAGRGVDRHGHRRRDHRLRVSCDDGTAPDAGRVQEDAG